MKHYVVKNILRCFLTFFLVFGDRLSVMTCLAPSDCQCRSRNSPGFDPSIFRHSGIWGAADEAVLNTVHRKKIQKIPLFKKVLPPRGIKEVA
jgi:hypothetical protein